MKMLDRIIFAVIAITLCVLCVRSFQITPPVEAAGEILKVEIVGVRSFLELPVSLKTIGNRNISWRGWKERGLTEWEIAPGRLNLIFEKDNIVKCK